MAVDPRSVHGAEQVDEAVAEANDALESVTEASHDNAPDFDEPSERP